MGIFCTPFDVNDTVLNPEMFVPAHERLLAALGGLEVYVELDVELFDGVV